MISTATTQNDRGMTLGTTSRTTAGTTAPTTGSAFGVSLAVLAGCRTPEVAWGAGVIDARGVAAHRIKAELGAPDFRGHVSLRPAATDVLVPTTGHPAWSPPT